MHDAATSDHEENSVHDELRLIVYNKNDADSYFDYNDVDDFNDNVDLYSIRFFKLIVTDCKLRCSFLSLFELSINPLRSSG